MPGTAGRSGRLRKPTVLRAMEGNAGKRRLNADEPTPPPAAIVAPAWLDETGREFWDAHAPWLAEHGLLTELDVPLFSAACEQHSLYRRLMARVNQFPFAKTTKVIGDRADKALANRDRVLARFGFSPSDRARLSIKKQDDDPFENWQKKRGRA